MYTVFRIVLAMVGVMRRASQNVRLEGSSC